MTTQTTSSSAAENPVAPAGPDQALVSRYGGADFGRCGLRCLVGF